MSPGLQQQPPVRRERENEVRAYEMGAAQRLEATHRAALGEASGPGLLGRTIAWVRRRLGAMKAAIRP